MLEDIRKRIARYENTDKWRSDINEASKNMTEIREATRDFDTHAKEDIITLLSLIDKYKEALTQCRANAKFLQHVPEIGRIYTLADKALEKE